MNSLKQKIEHISKGKFQGITPDLIFPETHLVLKIGEGELYKGSFLIENTADEDIRGLVYSSAFRMQTKEAGFEGKEVSIEFVYDGTGLLPGHVEDGTFTIVCNGGEYQISFTAIIQKPFIETSIGKIQNLHGFKKLAYQNIEEAQKIFRHREFYELIKYESDQVKHVYDHMRTWNLSALGMEEFLVGIKQKERIFLTMDHYVQTVKDLLEPYSDSIVISKNTWGYVEVSVEVEGEFIEIEKDQFTTNDFELSSYEFKYTIKNHKLHTGKNLGRIIFTTAYEKLEFVVEISKGGIVDLSHRTNDFLYAKLMKSYLKLESGKISTESWYAKTTDYIHQFKAVEGDESRYSLYQAHACMIAGQKQEAKWILENHTFNKFSVARDIELYAYYLFLCAILERESSKMKKAIDELQHIYMKNSKLWKVLCMLVQIDPYYNDFYERNHALEAQFNDGARNSFIYLVAFQTFKERSSNLKRLGNFEIQVLRFATKYNLMTKELALYTANLASQQKEYDKRIFELLTLAYDKLKEPMILHAICTILIHGDIVDNYAFKWYELAIKEEVKIARLFEYYMNSIDPDKVKEPLPRTIHLYFAHGNTLPYDKAALLYANLIQHEKNTSELYEYYREDMRVFALQQLSLGRITPQLRIIYKAILKDYSLSMEQIKSIYQIAHTYKITTQVENIRSIQVIHTSGELGEKIPYTTEGAKLAIYDPEEILVWETTSGERYIGTVIYDSERLFYELSFIDMCKKHLNINAATMELKEEHNLTLENLKAFGLKPYNLDLVKQYCSNKIMEEDFVLDDYLLHVAYQLFKSEHYDKVIMSYLVTYYTGPTLEMKAIWHAARDFEMSTNKLAEKILTQEIFSEQIFNDDEIFKDYYTNGAHFRLQKAYLSLSARKYIMYNRELSETVVSVILSSLKNMEEITDIVKIAILKYFAYTPYEMEYKQVLKECMQALCEKQLYFPFFNCYGEEWLQEVQLWDKALIAFSTKNQGQVKLYYKLYKEGMIAPEYSKEVLAPMFENVYVKKFLVFEDEILEYYFEETLGDEVITSPAKIHKNDSNNKYVGKFGRLNSIISDPNQRDEKMKAYALEEALAQKMFVPYD